MSGSGGGQPEKACSAGFETAFDIGTAVVIHGLTSEAGKLLNWRCGDVVRGLDQFSGRVGVIIGGEDMLGEHPRAILPVNLRLLGPNTRGVHIKRALRDPEPTHEAWVDIPADEALGVSMRRLTSDFGALHFYWPPGRKSLQAIDTIHSLGVSPGQTFGMVAVFPVSPHTPQPVWTPADDPIFPVCQDDSDQDSHCSVSVVADTCPLSHVLQTVTTAPQL